MKKIVCAALNRAEGPSRECFAVVYHVGVRPDVATEMRHFNGADYIVSSEQSISGDVLDRIRRWSHSAPMPGEGYNKVDFLVRWDDGSSYEGRFDMQRDGCDDTGENFWQSLRWELYAQSRKENGVMVPA